MKNVKNRFYIVLGLILFLAACGNVAEKSTDTSPISEGQADMESSQTQERQDDSGISTDFYQKESAGEQKASSKNIEQGVQKQDNDDRMVIYAAQLHIKVKDFSKAEEGLTKQAQKYGGYMVESDVTKDEEKQLSGTLTFRIPTEKFSNYLQATEGLAEEVLQRNINGQDVTEQYVDLQSRLKSKRVVEERLTGFMKEAKKTEDLLKIASELGKVQEEIEQIIGKMKYLENQTDYSTIRIFATEDNIVVPDLKKDPINIWERTKQQFIVSMNLLLTGFSSLFVFFVGNILIVALVAALGFGLYYRLRKKRHERPMESNNEEQNNE